MNDRAANFLVLTSGNCGAIWLASALNLHEQIFAGCGAYHPIESCFRYDLKKDGQALVRASRPHHYRFGAHPQRMRRILDQHGLGFDFPSRDYARLAWFVLEELAGLPDSARYRALGSIHAMTATRFAECRRADPHLLADRDVVLTNMIRHPVPRTEAFIRAFMAYQLDPPREGEDRDASTPYVTYRATINAWIETHRDECRQIERAFGISFDDPRACAVLFVYRIGHSAAWVANELREFSVLPALKMEALQSDGDYLARAVSLLTGGRVTAGAAYLDHVYRPENLGVGRRTVPDGTRPPDARAQWEAWSDWERAEFLACCRQERLLDAYVGHGYDFSFVH